MKQPDLLKHLQNAGFQAEALAGSWPERLHDFRALAVNAHEPSTFKSLAQIIPKRSIPVGFEDDKCLASTLHPSSCPRPAPGSRFTTSYARVDVCPKKVFYGEDARNGPKPVVEMSMKADVAHRFWLGKVNITAAMAKGQVKAKGPIPKILKLVPLTKILFPRYREALVRSGRSDLVEA